MGIRLAFTDEHFTPLGAPMPGVPMLLDDDEQFLEIPQRWLLHVAVARGRTRSPATWRSYAEGCVDWLRTCEANGWRWQEPTRDQLAAYRNHMLRVRTAFGRPFATATINGRLRRLFLFYRWAAAEGLLAPLDVPYQEVAVSRDPQWELLGHLGIATSRAANTLLLREELRQPRSLTGGELVGVRRELANERDQLIFEWGLRTGARVSEIAGLLVEQVPVIPPGYASRYVTVTLWITKGGRKRLLWVPLSLLDRTRRYIERDRRRLLRSRGLTGGGAPQALWIGRWGRPLRVGSIQNIFRSASRRAGFGALTFHMLRHTYAIAMLRIFTYLNREQGVSGSLNALNAVRVLLGHASLRTTSIYLQSLQIDEAGLETAMDELGELLASPPVVTDAS